jgi:hypothetical protein
VEVNTTPTASAQETGADHLGDADSYIKPDGVTTIKIDEDFDQWTEEKQKDFLSVRFLSFCCTMFRYISNIDLFHFISASFVHPRT